MQVVRLSMPLFFIVLSVAYALLILQLHKLHWGPVGTDLFSTRYLYRTFFVCHH